MQAPEPRWARVLLVLLGGIATIIGVLLVTRPFTSVALFLAVLTVGLTVVALIEVTRALRSHRHRAWRIILASVSLLIAGVLFIAPAMGTHWVIVALGLLLAASGTRKVLRAIGTRKDRATTLLWGATELIFGALVLAWPDVTLLVAGTFFGAWIAVRGVRFVLAAVRRTPRESVHARARWAEPVLACVAFITAVSMAFGGATLAGKPIPDDFTVAPDDVPDAPGQLIRAEPFTRAVPSGADAWRILYTTTRGDGTPAVSSGLVVIPDGHDQPPVIGWAHGTTGVSVGCAPSLLPDPFAAGGMPNFEHALDEGWAVVATDYVGLGADAPHEYLVGESAARGTLDALRAARTLEGVELAESTVVWGHSQGGAAALWTGGAAERYAPELTLEGVVAMAPAANLPSMIDSLADKPAGAFVGPFVITGFAAAYDDVDVSDYVRPEAGLLVSEMAKRCWVDRDAMVSLAEAGTLGQPIWSQNPADGPLGTRLQENIPTETIEAPLLVAQGETDTLVLPSAQKKYVQSRCADGQPVDYRTYAGRDHMGIVSAGSPLLGELMDWTKDRFAGKLATDTCAPSD